MIWRLFPASDIAVTLKTHLFLKQSPEESIDNAIICLRKNIGYLGTTFSRVFYYHLCLFICSILGITTFNYKLPSNLQRLPSSGKDLTYTVVC